MRLIFFVVIAVVFLSACDDARVYETNYDFDNRYWVITDKPAFEFVVNDTTQAYNLYCNLRNSVSYPYTRIFVSYILRDSLGAELKKELIHQNLFDQKTGEPLGASGLGDIYDQRILLIKNYTFKNTGKYSVQFEQFMRTDTLSGVLAVGLRVEKALEEIK
jgi:gliding motility-associated lipoprotein GldH